MSTRAKRLLAIVIAVMFALLLGEGAMRIRHKLKYGTATATVHRFTTDEESGLPVPAPGYRTHLITHDSRGFRSPELTEPRPPGRIRLAFLGGSTTYCAETSGDAETWPALVCASLRQRFPTAEFDFVNGGVPGYAVEHSIKNLAHRVKPLRPDVIVVYHLANDFSGDTRVLAEEKGLWRGKVEDPSWLARHSVLWHSIEKNLEVRARMRAAAAGENRLEYDPRDLSRDFHRDLSRLLRDAREVAPVVAVATFSTQARREQPQDVQLKACNTALFYMPYMSIQGLLDGWGEYNRVIRETAKETGVLLIGGESDIPGDRAHFHDSVHFTDAGCEAMARRVVETLAAADSFRALVAKKGRDG
ncbi:MAG: SGNH/GDSL hydrolase family protein [Planctomycetota bacterium]